MKIAWLRTSARGIEKSLEKRSEQVTNDHRATFSFCERDGEILIFISTLAKHDRTRQREEEIIEKVKSLMNSK